MLVWLALLILPFVAPNAYFVSLANMMLINIILIASLNLLMGYGGQISLGHAGFYGLGAYVSGVLGVKFGLSAWAGLPAAALLTGLAALVIGIPALRLRGLYLSMATLGWNAILVVMFNRLIDVTGGPNGLLGVKPFALGAFKLDTDIRQFPLLWLVSLLVMLAILQFVVLAHRQGAARGGDQRTRRRRGGHRQLPDQAACFRAERRHGGYRRQPLRPRRTNMRRRRRSASPIRSCWW